MAAPRDICAAGSAGEMQSGGAAGDDNGAAGEDGTGAARGSGEDCDNLGFRGQK